MRSKVVINYLDICADKAWLYTGGVGEIYFTNSQKLFFILNLQWLLRCDLLLAFVLMEKSHQLACLGDWPIDGIIYMWFWKGLDYDVPTIRLSEMMMIIRWNHLCLVVRNQRCNRPPQWVLIANLIVLSGLFGMIERADELVLNSIHFIRFLRCWICSSYQDLMLILNSIRITMGSRCRTSFEKLSHNATIGYRVLFKISRGHQVIYSEIVLSLFKFILIFGNPLTCTAILRFILAFLNHVILALANITTGVCISNLICVLQNTVASDNLACGAESSNNTLGSLVVYVEDQGSVFNPEVFLLHQAEEFETSRSCNRVVLWLLLQSTLRAFIILLFSPLFLFKNAAAAFWYRVWILRDRWHHRLWPEEEAIFPEWTSGRGGGGGWGGISFLVGDSAGWIRIENLDRLLACREKLIEGSILVLKLRLAEGVGPWGRGQGGRFRKGSGVVKHLVSRRR